MWLQAQSMKYHCSLISLYLQDKCDFQSTAHPHLLQVYTTGNWGFLAAKNLKVRAFAILIAIVAIICIIIANEKAVIGTSISPTVTQECSSSMVYSTPHVIIVNEANPAGHSNGINAVVITVSLILVLVVVAVVSGVGFTMWHCRRKGQK